MGKKSTLVTFIWLLQKHIIIIVYKWYIKLHVHFIEDENY